VLAAQPILKRLFEGARFGPFSNLHTCISLVEVYRFAQCLGWRFSPISTFFSCKSSRAFRVAPHSRFRRRDTSQCLPNFLKMLLLALPQIYTRVFHLWKSIDLHNFWIGDFRPYQVSFRWYVLARLTIRHIRVLGAGFQTNAFLTFQRCYL